MDYSNTVSKKKLKTRVQEAFTSFVSIFIKKQKCLEESPADLTEELLKVNEEYIKLNDDNSFEGLKDTYEAYRVGVNPEGGLIAIEKNTGYVKEEPDFVAKVRFATLWRKSAFANLDMKTSTIVKIGDDIQSGKIKKVLENAKVDLSNIRISKNNG